MKRQSGFTLIGAFVVVVLGALFIGAVAYVCKLCVDRARTIERARQQQLTNELVAPMLNVLPSHSAWTLDDGEAAIIQQADGQLTLSIPDEALSNIVAGVGAYRVEASRSVGDRSTETWSGQAMFLTGSASSVRSTLLDLLRYEAQQQPYPSCGFYRYAKQ